MLSLDTLPLPCSSQTIGRTSSARLARHQESATTATESAMRTTRRTPFMPAIAFSSTDFTRAAEYRTLPDGGVQHAGQADVDRVNRPRGYLVGHIETPARRAQQLPVLRIFQRRVFDFDLGGVHGDGGERRRAAARLWVIVLMRATHSDAGTFHRAAAAPISISRAVAPACRKIKLRRSDRAAGSGRHVAVDPMAAEILAGGDEFSADFGPVAFKLFRHQHGEPGLRALPHLGMRDADHDRIVRVEW